MAQPYQGIRISLNNTDINKVRNDFNSLVDELKKKAEQPINFKANIVGIKDSLKKESKNIDELIQAYEKLGNVKVKPLAYDNEGNLQKFKISIQQANGILEELTYKANKFEDVVGKLKPIGFELKGIKELDNSEKIITNLVETQNKLYRELNNLQNEEFSIKQQLIKLDGQDKQLLEEKLNIIRQQQKSTGQLLNQNNLKDTDKNNSILLERLKLTNDLTISQEKYNKTLANQVANKRESGKTPSQQQAEDAKAQAQAYNKLLDSNYTSIVSFRSKQNAVLDNIKQDYKNTFTTEDIIKFEQELDKLSPKSENLQRDFDELQKKIAQFQNTLKMQQYDSNLGDIVKTSTPFDFNAPTETVKKYVTELIGANAQITKIVPKTDQFGRNIKEVSVRTKDGANTWKNYNLVLNESQGTITKVDKGISNVGNKMVSLGDKMKSMMQGIALWAGGMTIFYGSIRKLQEGLEFINKINKSETNIQMIGGYSREQVQGLTQDYSKLADQLYTTTGSMMEGAEEFLRAGNTIEETQSLLKATTIGGAISGQSSQEMAEELVAISNGFKMATNDATQMMNVIDTLSTLDNNSATSMKEISTALMRTASSAQMAGVSFGELSSYIATVSSVNFAA